MDTEKTNGDDNCRIKNKNGEWSMATYGQRKMSLLPRSTSIPKPSDMGDIVYGPRYRIPGHGRIRGKLVIFKESLTSDRVPMRFNHGINRYRDLGAENRL